MVHFVPTSPIGYVRLGAVHDPVPVLPVEAIEDGAALKAMLLKRGLHNFDLAAKQLGTTTAALYDAVRGIYRFNLDDITAHLDAQL